MTEPENKPPPSVSGGIRLDTTAIEAARQSASKYSKEKGRLSRLAEQLEDGGSVGIILGKLPYQAGSIAFLTILGLLIILLVSVIGMLVIGADQKEGLAKIEDVKNIILSILGLTGTILGYIFGKSGQLESPPSEKNKDGD